MVFASTLHYSIMFLMLLWVYFLFLLMANDFEFQKFSQKYVIIIRIYSRISLYVHYDSCAYLCIYTIHEHFNMLILRFCWRIDAAVYYIKHFSHFSLNSAAQPYRFNTCNFWCQIALVVVIYCSQIYT